MVHVKDPASKKNCSLFLRSRESPFVYFACHDLDVKEGSKHTGCLEGQS